MSTTESSSNPFVRMHGVHRVGVFLAYVAFFATVLLVGASNPAPGLGWIHLGLGAYLLVLLLPLLSGRDLGWFHPLIFPALLLFPNLLRSLSHYSVGLEHHVALPELRPQELNRIVGFKLALMTLGTCCTYLGYYLAGRSRALPFPRASAKPANLASKALILIGVSSAVLLVYMAAKGGLQSHFMALGGGRERAIGGQYYVISGTEIGWAALLVWLAWDRHAHRHWLWWLGFAFYLCVAFALTGSRSAVVWRALTPLLIFMLRERRILFMRVGALALAAVYAVGVLGEVRKGTLGGEVEVDAALEPTFAERIEDTWSTEMTSRSGSGSGVYPVLARVPEQVGHLYGDSYLALLVLPVPRVLWPDKPGLVGGRVGSTFFHKNAGIPPGAVGEAYWNFHVPGVAIVFFLFGIFLRALTNGFRRAANNPLALIVYVIVVLNFTQPATNTASLLARTLLPIFTCFFLLGVFGSRKARVS